MNLSLYWKYKDKEKSTYDELQRTSKFVTECMPEVLKVLEKGNAQKVMIKNITDKEDTKESASEESKEISVQKS